MARDARLFAPASEWAELRGSGRVEIYPPLKLGFLSLSLSSLRRPLHLNAVNVPLFRSLQLLLLPQFCNGTSLWKFSVWILFFLFLSVLADLAVETVKYVFPKRFDSSNLEEALMSVPDLETMNFRVLSRTDKYEIREVEPYFVAETTMPGETGFDFYGASRSFNALADYLFGKNTINEKMEMTTPVVTRKVQSVGKKMEMTTPVITRKAKDETQWQMSFVMPSKYGSNLPLPKDPSVKIQEVPRKIVAVVAFSGYVTDEEIERREQELRRAIQHDKKYRVKDGVSVEVAQYNPPFTLPFTRRNEVSLEVESKED